MSLPRIIVSENLGHALARMTAANEFTVLNGWTEGLVGTVSARGKVITWKGGGNWKKT